MDPIEKTFIDKTGWVDGPWMHEPDRIEWRHEAAPSLACLIVRGHLGALCGYVGLPPGHPWHGKDYGADDMSPDVHGGLTFAAPCDEDGRICHVPQPGEPADVWWLGFDCGHGGDYFMMASGRIMAEKRPDLFSGTYEPPPPGTDPFWTTHGTYRDIAYVRAEVERLAEQCAAAVLTEVSR
jgi:hypothetical protein